MNNAKKNILALTCAAILTTKAHAALPLKYSFDQLDAFWTSQVTAPDMNMYSKLASQKTTISGTVKEKDPDEPSDDDLNAPPHDEEVSGEVEFPAGGTTKLVIFPVISPTRATAGMMKRNAVLQNYLGKERLYTQTGTLDQLAKIEQRRNAVQLELFLISLMRFAQAQTLAGRCEYIKDAQDLNRILTDRNLLRGGLPVPSGFESLIATQQTVAAAYDLPSLNRLSCSARVVTSKAELLRHMQDRVADRLLDNTPGTELLWGYDDRQKIVMSKQLEAYKKREDSVLAVDMLVSKLITMRDQLANIRSSYQLVKGDAFGLNVAPEGIMSSMQQLEKIPYKQLKIDFPVENATAPADGPLPKYRLTLNDTKAKYAAVIGDQIGLKAILKSYVDLYAKAPDNLKTVLLPCSTLLDKFTSVESKMISGDSSNASEVQEFKTTFANCLTSATDTFVAQQALTEGKYKIDDGFAKLLSILSNTVIEIKKRPN